MVRTSGRNREGLAPDCIPWVPAKAIPHLENQQNRGMDAETGEGRGGGMPKRSGVKSVYAIAGIGAVGCLLLSYMMKHLLEVKTENSASPVAIELRDMAGRSIVGDVDVQVVMENGVRTMIVRLEARQGVDRQKWATGLGRLLWRRALALREPPARIRFEVAGEGGEPPLRVDIDQPTAKAPSSVPPAAGVPAAPPARRE
jgi:hypothetical protein